jgi:hypothetical protein
MPMPAGFAGPVVDGGSVCATAAVSALASRGEPVFTPNVRGGARPLHYVLENHDDNTPNGTFAIDPASGQIVVNTPSLVSFCGCLPEYAGARYADIHVEVTGNDGVEAFQGIALSVQVTGCTQAACPTPLRTSES